MNYVPSSAEVKQLRDETGAGIMDCKRSLSQAGGDLSKARDLLRQWGLAGVEKRKGRSASEGAVETYIHRTDPEMPARVGVLVELNCETDFVAKTPGFRELAREIAMHISWARPRWVSRDQVPEDHLEKERKILLDSDLVANKPDNVKEKIVEGKISAMLSEQGGVLLDQVFIKDEGGKKKIGDLVSDFAASVKENVVVRRFARFELGEED
jgi:elongation factor Ts